MTDTLEPRVSRRRLALAAAVAALAASGGAWLGWRRSTPQAAAPVAAEAWWSQQFDTPAGAAPLVAASLRGKPLVLNFWASWCAPCVREMPALDRFHREFGPRGWQVVGLAIDGPTPVREFLAKTPVGFPIGLAGLTGTELVRALGNAQGGLPFTVVFDASGRIVHQKLGETSFDELAAVARSTG
ncbi:TlpA disulfide reductase family protein [Caldimonas sp. KR1-144]|uniref:TlpA disulfide reductase family protein n=1 Tax=Caldimonas sp. KR1-144 TaxID=3400911 RepID=UPI003C0BD3C5